MAKVTIKATGDKELAEKLRAMGDDANDMMLKALEAGALLIQNEAKRLVPKRTSSLSRSITIETMINGNGRAEARIGPSMETGKWIEFGTGIYAEKGDGRKTPWVYKAGDGKFYTTRGMKPRPFMRPAFDEKKEAALKVYQKVLRQLVEKHESGS